MENTEQTQTSTTPELSIADLQNLKTLVDIAVRRGAFAATEISSIGAVYDRLNAFLESIPKPTSKEEGKATPPEMGTPEISAAA
jgi:hypothetical protein